MDLYGQNAQEFVTCIVLDKTASMVGKPDGSNIWADVQNYTLNMIDAISINTTVIVFEFDGKCYGPKTFTISQQADKGAIKTYVKSVKPDGQSTAIYNALDVAWQYMQNNYSNHNKIIYLITDGRDNASQMSFSSVLSKFSANKGEYDHLYYIDLRDMADANIKNLVSQTESVSITKGFVKTITVQPIFQEIPVTLDKSNKIEQRFAISGGVLPESFSFNCQVVSPNNINADINPSGNIGQQNLTKIDDGKYSFQFGLDILQGQLVDSAEFKISLHSNSINEYLITFQPETFTILLKNKDVAKVKAKNGGWR